MLGRDAKIAPAELHCQRPEESMSDRERWTVYPLLFLALGVALRSSGMFGPTKQVLCHRLRIEGTEGKPAIDLLALPQGGVIQVIGANGQPQVVLESSQHGGI